MMRMELSRAWIAYCEDRLPNGAGRSITLDPEEQLSLLYDHAGLFTPRMPMIRATRFAAAFDDEADRALLELSRHDSFEGFDRMTAGGWRVMYDRFLYACVVLAAVMASGRPVMMTLPDGLDRPVLARAFLLRLLLGPARSIDRAMLPAEDHGTSRTFPPGFPGRLQ
jgi:hypothetical protein